MPSIAQIPMSSSITSSPPGGKKRKREQLSYGDGEDYTKLSGIQYTSPLPPSRSLFTTSLPENAPTATTHHTSHAPRLVLKPRPLKPLRPHDAKRQRISHPEPGKQQQDVSSTLEHELYAAGTGSTNAHPTSIRSSSAREEGFARTDLRSCHICHQKPKVRTDLDSYGDCEGCGERTCYICMRECLGPASPVAWEMGERESEMGREMSFTTGEDRVRLEEQAEERGFDVGAAHVHGDSGSGGWLGKMERDWGHRGMVCSQCCVERGVDGEVRCLGCLRAEEGG